ncbi:MAG: hypothetical protein J1F11_03355 [Oscillospiraceae bacterium]|nr:hypothetical protein [Oscillospiraceae bacterium]
MNGNVFGMITDYTDIAKDVADIVPDWISTAATAVSDTINNYVEVPTPTYSIGSILNYDPSEDEDTIEDAEQTMKKLWDSVSMQENLGLISSEEAYRRRLDLIQEYCPEYSDEWYSYYKTILDYQRDALEEQVQDVQDGLSDIVSEYKAAYSKIESSVNSYKNKLLTVGDVFTITKEKDGEGNETKTYTVENLTEQMNKMRQYHKVIKELKERGVSDDVLRQLTTFDMDDGMVFAENLAKSSDAELEKINELYAERDKLAGDLANDLYAPEMDKLNSELIDSVVDRFGSLPEEIRAIGGESLAAFVEGILGDKDDLTAAAQEFIDSFFTACEEGISSAAIGMKNVGQNIADILGEQGSYSIRYGSGRKASDVSAEKMNSIYENAMAAHDHMANIMAASQQFNSYNYYENAPQASSRRDEKIVLDNKADITVKLDRETIGQTIYEWIKEYKWRTGT